MQIDRASKLHGSMLEGMNIQGTTGLTHAQVATLKALGAIAQWSECSLGTRRERVNTVLNSRILSGEIWSCLADSVRGAIAYFINPWG